MTSTPTISDPQVVHRRFVTHTVALYSVYSIANIAAIFGAFDHVPAASNYGFALALGITVATHLWAFVVWLRDSDEFVRTLAAKRFIVATGLTMAFTTTWGFLELYAEAPHFPLALILPVLWGSWGLVTPFIRTTH